MVSLTRRPSLPVAQGEPPTGVFPRSPSCSTGVLKGTQSDPLVSGLVSPTMTYEDGLKTNDVERFDKILSKELPDSLCKRGTNHYNS